MTSGLCPLPKTLGHHVEAFPDALGMPKGFLLVADFFYLFQLTGFFPVA